MITKNYPNNKNIPKVSGLLFKYDGDIPYTLIKIDINENIAYKEEIENFRKMEEFLDYSDELFLETFRNYLYDGGVNKNRENVTFRLKFLLNDKRKEVYERIWIRGVKTNHFYKDAFTIAEKNNWHPYWTELEIFYNEIYNRYRNDPKVNVQRLLDLSNSWKGDISAIEKQLNEEGLI